MPECIGHWKGGSHTALEREKVSPKIVRRIADADLDVVRKMASRDGQDAITRVLNKLKRRPRTGEPWGQIAVKTATPQSRHRRMRALPGGRGRADAAGCRAIDQDERHHDQETRGWRDPAHAPGRPACALGNSSHRPRQRARARRPRPVEAHRARRAGGHVRHAARTLPMKSRG